MLYFFDVLISSKQNFDKTNEKENLSIKRRAKSLLATAADNYLEISRFLARILPNGATVFYKDQNKKRAVWSEEQVDWSRVLTRLENDCEDEEFVWDDRHRKIFKNFLEKEISLYLKLKVLFIALINGKLKILKNYRVL